MRRKSYLLAGIVAGILTTSSVKALEYHVAVSGKDTNQGTATAPFRTIQKAADLAQPGDVVTVHAGVYREWVDPPRGGSSANNPIVYRSAPGEKAEIKGSEVVKGWKQVGANVWTVSLDNNFFGNFNPYVDFVRGDYMFANKLNQHTGMVYLDGAPIIEAASKDEFEKSSGKPPMWFGDVNGEKTTLWGWFKDADPNQRTVEINVRRTVFYPSHERINYITVRGFQLSQAASNWAPPTAEQIGLIGTHWSRGWTIEDNTITHSRCVGITLGKFGDKYDNTYGMNSQGWTKGVDEARAYGWSKEAVGHHLVRNNTIARCGQAGIVGSLGAVFSTISNNVIHDCGSIQGFNQRFNGYETAGIKIHAAVDVTISGNHIYHSAKGIWLDWMTQGARITRNLFHDNREMDLFVEVNHGPILVDNNLFLSSKAILDASEGGAYVHNLFAGKIEQRKETRQTPIFKPHTVEFVANVRVGDGDDRFYNNLFLNNGLAGYDDRENIRMGGNAFFGSGGKPSVHEQSPLVLPARSGAVKLEKQPDGYYLQADLSVAAEKAAACSVVTSELLGEVINAKQRFVNPDGSPIRIDADFFGHPWLEGKPLPGPFAAREADRVKVWANGGVK
jgi:alpha-N-arabinofuranosidase